MKTDHLLLFYLLASVATTSLSFKSLAFVNDVSGPRHRLLVEAIASPLDQIKLDFIGSLENAYDFNDANPASTLFLNELVEQVRVSQYNFNALNIFLTCCDQ